MAVVIFHVINTMFVMILLIYLPLKERNKNTECLPRVGFLLIGLFSVFIVLMFVSFALDLLIINIAYSQGYTASYYLAWFFALTGLFCGYLGYTLLGWFKKLFKLSD